MFKKGGLFSSFGRKKEIEAEELTPAASESSSETAENEKDDAAEAAQQPMYDNSKALERIAAQFNQVDKTEINAGARAFGQKDYDEAIEHYEKALSINPSDGSIYNNIGNVFFRGKNEPEAAQLYYMKATEVQPSFNFSWLNLAICQRDLGRKASALETVRKGLNHLDPKDNLFGVLVKLEAELEASESESKESKPEQI